MKKTFLLIGTIGILTAATAMTAFADGLTQQQAREKADQYVPADSTYLETDTDWDEYEFKYYSKDKQEKYKVTISRTAEKTSSFESERHDTDGGRTASLTEKKANEIVSNEITSAKILSTVLEKEDGLQYEIIFAADSCYGTYKIHAENGTVLERDIYIGTLQKDHSKSVIGIEKAKQIALKKVPGATAKKCKLDIDDGRAYYKGELKNGNWEYEYRIDAFDGTVLKWEQDFDD